MRIGNERDGVGYYGIGKNFGQVGRDHMMERKVLVL